MAELYDLLKPQKTYWDKKNYSTLQAYNNALAVSTTVYVGNLSFYTQQNSIKQLFSRAGNVKNIIMGIDNDGNPCGFCFVEYQTRNQAQLAVQYVSKTRLGGRIIRVDWDPGYMEGRQKGRGTSGQQRRDDFRNKQDPQRPRKKIVNNNQQTSHTFRNDSHHKGGNNYRQNDRRDERRDFKSRQQRYDRGDRSEGYNRGDRYNNRSDRDNRGDRDYNRRDNQQHRQARQNRQTRQQRQSKKQQTEY